MVIAIGYCYCRGCFVDQERPSVSRAAGQGPDSPLASRWTGARSSRATCTPSSPRSSRWTITSRKCRSCGSRCMTVTGTPASGHTMTTSWGAWSAQWARYSPLLSPRGRRPGVAPLACPQPVAQLGCGVSCGGILPFGGSLLPGAGLLHSLPGKVAQCGLQKGLAVPGTYHRHSCPLQDIVIAISGTP